MNDTTEIDIVPVQKLSARVDGCFVADRSDFASHPVDALTLDFTGVVGDRHAGGTRRATVFEPWHQRGSDIRNDRQVTIVSVEELREVAAAMLIAELRPEWIVANLALSGVPRLSALPPGTRLVFDDGPVLFVEGENDPCRMSGASVGRHYPERDGFDLLFPKVGKHRRGLTASVDAAGTIRPGAAVEVRVPPQRLYRA